MLFGFSLVLLLGGGTSASNILFLVPFSMKSHWGFYASVATTLAKHGHEVTFVSAFETNEQIAGVREIALPQLDVTLAMPSMLGFTIIDALKLLPFAASHCANALEDPRINQLFDETFDLIMMSTLASNCLLKFVHHFKVPYIWVHRNSMESELDALFGNPSFPSYDVSLRYDASLPMSFADRVVNIFKGLTNRFLYGFIVYSWIEKESRDRGLFPDDMPSLDEMHRKVSLLFLNGIRSMETSKAFVPNVIHAGGLHLRPAKPLPQDLEDWVQGSGDFGFIYFSFGSIFQTSDMPEKDRKALVRGLGRLKQRVLWKWNEGHMEDLPPNVRVAKWLPQQDILAHPKIRLFISHGGINSLQEALHHNVPIIGMPMFSDQSHNIGMGHREGWAYRLEWQDLTEEKFVKAVEGALTDSRLHENVRKKSAIVRDQPMTSEETVVYWTEYVIRHGGADHLRCPAVDMSWFILYNFDVWLALFLAICLVVFIPFALLRCCLRRCCRGTKKHHTD
ncbi:UDP-glucosyltransferase 2-like isoform X1 [Oratosquilla oratoria]|uniref:UDP-glucosyltransferase 2-like isoform X1 n=2 Tax=Oratosquilla oratoria TaxID=337810 RepID=UPI003F7615EC